MTGRKGHVVSQLALLSPSIDCPLLAAIRLSWSLLPAALTMRALSAPPGKNHPSVRTVHFIQKQGWHWSIRIQQPVVKEEGSARPCREKTIVLSFFQKYGPLANWSCVGGQSGKQTAVRKIRKQECGKNWSFSWAFVFPLSLVSEGDSMKLVGKGGPFPLACSFPGLWTMTCYSTLGT